VKARESLEVARDKPAAVTSSHLASLGCGRYGCGNPAGRQHKSGYTYRCRGREDQPEREAIKDKTGQGNRSKGKRQH